MKIVFSYGKDKHEIELQAQEIDVQKSGWPDLVRKKIIDSLSGTLKITREELLHYVVILQNAKEIHVEPL